MVPACCLGSLSRWQRSNPKHKSSNRGSLWPLCLSNVPCLLLLPPTWKLLLWMLSSFKSSDSVACSLFSKLSVLD